MKQASQVVSDEALAAYCNAWQESFEKDNPYHTVTMSAEDRKHIMYGLEMFIKFVNNGNKQS